ncbi:hypothetical protein HBF26_18235 [Luteibacter jiangsuensis]|uniref:Uncharacterized protein n=1 Tax=Luteibacter jiangsuensis TaxID=637577 RepID=A0ABX0QAS1_9GAMM|nr:hypothetical protein [Luteibacter jiangsuensis]NID06831.1 hypothetical protein [Luteibacter jiangsuensis]
MTKLVRILRNDVPLKPPLAPEGQGVREATGSTLSGSVLRHFDVSVNGRLSFYRLEDPLKLDDIALAIVAGSKAIDDVSYIELDEEVLSGLGLQQEATRGATVFEQVNAAHIDLVQLSVDATAALAIACANAATQGFESGKQLGLRLAAAVAKGECQEDRLKDGVRKRLAEIRGSRDYKRMIRQGLVPP